MNFTFSKYPRISHPENRASQEMTPEEMFQQECCESHRIVVSKLSCIL